MMSLLRLDGFEVSRLEYRLRESFVSAFHKGGKHEDYSDNNPQWGYEFNLYHTENDTHFWVIYGVDLTWASRSKSRFTRVRISMNGFFSLPEDMPPDEKGKFVPTLCLATLHSNARGVLAQATGTVPKGPFLLPMVDMSATMKEITQANKG